MHDSIDLPDSTRRALLKSAIVLLGGSIAGLPTALTAKQTASRRFFSKAQYAVLDEVAEIILPRTDTPGARDAGVPAAIDTLMTTWASSERRQLFRGLLDDIDRAAVARSGKPLVLLPPAQRIEIVVAYDKDHAMRDPVYRKFKELVLIAYFLSEPGATQELRYEHTPGRWQPVVPVTSETRAWAITGST